MSDEKIEGAKVSGNQFASFIKRALRHRNSQTPPTTNGETAPPNMDMNYSTALNRFSRSGVVVVVVVEAGA